MKNETVSQRPLDTFMRLLLVSLLIAWCFLIAKPFLVIIIWAVIIAVSVYPMYAKLVSLFKGKRSLAVGVFLLILLVLVALPSIQISRTLLQHSEEIKVILQDPDLEIPPPNAKVKDWPVIGTSLYSLWYEASVGIQDFIKHHSEEATKVGAWLLKGLASVFGDAVVSLLSFFFAGFLLYHSKSGYEGTLEFCNKVIGDRGMVYVKTARDTIKSVVQGIILIAVIQATAAFIGFELIGVQAPALLAILILILAVIQLPVILVTLPVAIYVFSVADTTPAILFAIYMVIIGVLDNVRKPIFLGRGVQVPLFIILIGSLGGLVLHGILGLFVGAVVMALGYQTYQLWLSNDIALEEPEKTIEKA